MTLPCLPSAICRMLVIVSLFSAMLLGGATREASGAEPIKVLVVTGGCCHDYDYQTKAMQLSAKEQGIDIEWTIVFEGGKGTRA